MTGNRVGVIGATSSVGGCVLSRLVEAQHPVVAFSRISQKNVLDSVNWQQLSAPLADDLIPEAGSINHWICTAPIWVLPQHFGTLETLGAKRIVAVSSTSRLTKQDSTDPGERATALRLTEAEDKLQKWAEDQGIDWVVLRPTLIYGLGRDRNIADIARFIRRFRFFPLLGKAVGRRQPIHAQDVADACVAAMQTPGVRNRAYDISGGETLSYREMVARIFKALDQPPLMFSMPLFAFRPVVALLRVVPRFRHLSAAMAERMNRDLVFNHVEATQDFGFQPRKFILTARDLPR